jgi:hypothetical protein
MNTLYLTRATILYGGSAFLIYSYPAISQAVGIALLALLWLICAHTTFSGLQSRFAMARSRRFGGDPRSEPARARHNESSQ